MTPSVQKTLRQHHIHMVLHLHRDLVGTALNNPENARQGINRILGYASQRTGVPFPICCTVTTEAGGPGFMLEWQGQPILIGGLLDSGTQALTRLVLRLKLLPSTFFGIEQTIRWLQLAKL